MKQTLSRIIRTAIIIVLLVAAFPWLYEVKSKLGIDIIPKAHAGTLIEKYTHGIIKCEWFYPYHCYSNNTQNL